MSDGTVSRALIGPVSSTARSFPSSAVPEPPFTGPRPHHRLTLEAAAAYATHVDAARVRAAVEGRTFVYTVRWV
ncbi:MAG: hypothetical protein M1126_01805 [Candidatus Thermoplasmatota archaeon]|jgi:hypothetical protein|nr:hypothetical protein [Candidatus Thermoplasmatota archaeon]